MNCGEINEIILKSNTRARGKESDERKIISSPSALMGRGKSFIFASPLKTFLFARFIVILAHITRRKSVARKNGERKSFRQASLLSEKSEPEHFKEAIILFEQAQRARPLQTSGKNEIDKIIQRAVEIKRRKNSWHGRPRQS